MNTALARPNRLHHSAYVSGDLERTRHFYEDIVGLPLDIVWCEGEGDAAYCHAFFSLEDGGSLAFFQFADEASKQQQRAAKPTSPFYHLAINATKEVIERVHRKAQDEGLEAMVLDHGYCTSLYLTDPDDMVVELTLDTASAAHQIAERRKDPHAVLKRWLDGDHTPNNDIRHDAVDG